MKQCVRPETIVWFRISKYLFANEKKILNEIIYITEIRYVNFVD